MSKGLVVPDNPAPDDFIIVPFRIPNDPQWFGIIAGLLFSPCNGYWWKKDSGDWETAKETACIVASEFSMNLVEFCSQVEHCIETSEGVRDAIGDLTNQIINNYNFGDVNAPLSAGLDLDGCNPDIIFGITTGIIDYMNKSVVDFIEILEVATNVLEIMEIWFDKFPVANAFIAPALTFLNWFQGNIAENYAAQYTEGLRDTLRCELFCLWLDSPNCELTAADLAIFFINRLADGAGLFPTFADLVTFTVGGFWIGDEIVEIAFLAALGMMTLTEEQPIPFITIETLYSLSTVVALSSNDPDGDWSILCDDCPQGWCKVWDFTADNGGWASYAIAAGFGATYASGVGWKPINVVAGGRAHRAAVISFDVPATTNVKSIKITYDFSLGTFDETTSTFFWGVGSPNTTEDFTLNTGQASGSNLLNEYSGDVNATNRIYVYFRTSVRIPQSLTPNGDVTIKSIEISGDGENPDGENNC